MRRYLILVLIVSGLSSCGPTTEITASWNNQEAKNQTFSSIFVAALTENLRAKQVVENDLATALSKKGIRVGKSSEVFAPNFTDDHMVDKEKMLDRVREDGYEAILTVTLLSEDSESRYVPGSANYIPVTRYNWYGNFWGYYTTMYPSIYQQGYYVEDKAYFIETNLYSTITEDLIWSAQSKTYNPSDLEKFSEDLSSLILQELKKDVRLAQ